MSASQDETIDAIRDQFLRYADTEIAPHAQGWHQRDELIPIELVEQLGRDGRVRPDGAGEEHGGSGLGKIAMCVVSEALSGGYIGVGSLGTRAEIAAELIGIAGTPEQKARWLPAHRHRARCCRRRCSPSRTPAPTSAACAPARCGTATIYRGDRREDLDHPRRRAPT